MNQFENGYDSLKKSINLYSKLDSTKETYEYDLKDIVISFHHSIEVLYKYIIRKESEFLIYDNISVYCKNTIYNNANHKHETIKFMDAVRLVYLINNLEMDYEKIYYYDILNEIRNSITHSSYDFRDTLTEHYLANLIPEVYKILAKNIEEFDKQGNLDNILNSVNKIDKEETIRNFIIFADLIEKLSNCIESLSILETDKTKINSIFSTLDKKKMYDICPICGSKTFFRKGVIQLEVFKHIYYGKCHYCGIDINKDEIAILTNQYLLSFNPVNVIDYSEGEGKFQEIEIVEKFDALKNAYITEYKPVKPKFIMDQRKLDNMIIDFVEKNCSSNYQPSLEIKIKFREHLVGDNLEFRIEHRLGKLLQASMSDITRKYKNIRDNFKCIEEKENRYLIDEISEEMHPIINDYINGYLFLNDEVYEYIDNFETETLHYEGEYYEHELTLVSRIDLSKFNIVSCSKD
jgi:hypothetical protein